MKNVLITGGSSGIGYETSVYFARNGYRLLWVSKPPEELKEAKQKLQAIIPDCIIEILPIDLTLADAAKEVYSWAQSYGGVEVLINNAGIGTYGFVQDIPVEKDLALIQLNVLNMYKMTRLFLNDLLEKNSGSIINISSISAFQPTTRFNTYASSKAFVLHFTKGLEEELRLQKSKVHIMAVCPAAIKDTNFKAAAKMEGVRTFEGLVTTTAKEVAKDIWNAFNKQQNFLVSGSKMRWLYRIKGLIPYRIQQSLVAWESSRV